MVTFAYPYILAGCFDLCSLILCSCITSCFYLYLVLYFTILYVLLRLGTFRNPSWIFHNKKIYLRAWYIRLTSTRLLHLFHFVACPAVMECDTFAFFLSSLNTQNTCFYDKVTLTQFLIFLASVQYFTGVFMPKYRYVTALLNAYYIHLLMVIILWIFHVSSW